MTQSQEEPSFMLNAKNYILFAIVSGWYREFLMAPLYLMLGFLISSSITTLEENICSHFLGCANSLEWCGKFIQRCSTYFRDSKDKNEDKDKDEDN